MRLVSASVAGAALLASLAGAEGLGRTLLLTAIAAAAARLLEAVALATERRGDRLSVAMSVVAIACLVAAGATHVPWLAAGLFLCVALESLGRPEMVVELPVEAEPELRRAA